jgi:hypothetical protein
MCQARDAVAARGQANLAGLGVASLLRFEKERALDIAEADLSARASTCELPLGARADLAVMMRVVDELQHRLEELLQMLHIDDFLGS